MKLYDIPRNKWQAEYDQLMTDPYLSKKYNRERRIKDLRKFMGECTPELKHCKEKRVLDIGCAFGEYLEICREMGHYPSGVDAVIEDCDMGDEYIRLSQLMTERQKIKVAYTGLQAWVEEQHGEGEFFYIVSRGAINQCYKEHLLGPSHKITKDSGAQTWDMSPELWQKFYNLFFAINHVLEDGGFFYCWANGSANDPMYDHLFLQTLKKFPNLQLMKKIGKLRHKVKKVVEE